ncbi:hypothetical protein [Levilactobacillus acidifarinae]|nr:hypothetical protein [Levilactobacillus acidifarinae]
MDRSARGLFIKSNYLRSPKENECIRKKLLKDDYRKILTTDENTRIDDNFEMWITQCRKEWSKFGRHNPVKIKKDDPETHCQMCHQKLSSKKYRVKNSYTDEILWIGADCFEKIINNVEGLLGAGYNQEQARKFELFKRENPEIISFVSDKLSDNALYILPKYIMDHEANVLSEIRKYVKYHVISGSDSNSKLEDIYSEINKVSVRIKNFIQRSNPVKNISSDWAKQIINLQAGGKRIINSISENNGEIDKNIASRIKFHPFLVQYVNGMNSKWNDLHFGVRGNSGITITTMFDNKTFVIDVPSEVVISKLGYPGSFNDVNSSQDLLNVLTYRGATVNDSDTRRNLQLIAFESFKRSHYSRHDFSLGEVTKYISERERQMTDKTHVSKKRFESKARKSVFYQVGNYYVDLNVDELQQFGMWTLESHKFMVSDTLLAQQAKVSKDEILDDFYQDMQFAN